MAILFFLYLLLICYQDSPTAVSIGEIARSPIFFFLPFLVLWHWMSPPLKQPSYRKFGNLLLFLIYSFAVVTAVNAVYWFFQHAGDFDFMGENLLVKSAKEILYLVQFYILFLSSARFLEYFNENGLDVLRRTLAAFLVFMLCVLVVEIATMPNAFSFLHTENPYFRIRLLASESSWTGSIIITLSAIYLCLARSNSEKALGFFFLFVNVLVTGSKMVMVCFPVAFMIMYLRKFNIKRLVASALLATLAFVILVPVIISSFAADLEEYTSIVSRGTSFVNGLNTGYRSVIGVGGFYPYYFLENLNDSMNFLLQILGVGNTSEVEGWGSDGFKALSGGSTFAHLIMLTGIFGLLFFGGLIRRLFLFSKDNNYLLFAAVYFTISNFFSEVFFMRLTWAVFFAFLSFYKIHENELKGIGRNT